MIFDITYTTVIFPCHLQVIQWVQCERQTCKKWRKLPGSVDMSTLPETWYCEMNKWDPDRAYCGGPEETDSEGKKIREKGLDGGDEVEIGWWWW